MAAPAWKYESKKYLSLEEYLQMDQVSDVKLEYVEGDIVSMAGATKEHNQIVTNLIREIGPKLKGSDCEIYPSDFRITTPAHKSYFYPDATVVCGETKMQDGVFDTLLNPIVILEVVSDGTENIDRGYKFFHYQQIHTLQEYVLIDSRQHAIEIIRRQGEGAWKFERHFDLQVPVVLNSINIQMTFGDIYYRISFANK